MSSSLGKVGRSSSAALNSVDSATYCYREFAEKDRDLFAKFGVRAKVVPDGRYWKLAFYRQGGQPHERIR